MKQELMTQVASKAEKDSYFKECERVKHNEQLAQIERKLISDELDKRSYDKQVKAKINAGDQYEMVNRRRFDDDANNKQKDVQERRKIEESIMAANEADAK